MNIENPASFLKKKLLELKKRVDCEPVNATLSPGGMIIPALNGLKINMEKSLYHLQKQQKWDESLLLYEEIPAKYNITDLPPAPIYNGPEKPLVAFMVNVAWGNEHIQPLLEIMESAQIQCTFFLQGEWTHKFSNLARKIRDAGHEIGSHAYTHPDMRGMSQELIEWEIKKANQVINKELGFKPHLFTPPYGAFDERVLETAAREGMWTILYSVDSKDWMNPTPEVMVNDITAQIQKGSIVYFHPTEVTVKGLPALIGAIKEKSLKIVTVSEVLSPKREK